MNLPQFLTIEYLLGFMGTQQAAELASAIKAKDPTILGQLDTVEHKAWEHYNDLFDQGHHVLSHLGWLQVALGNYCSQLPTPEPGKALGFYHQAWQTFSGLLTMGHDEKAHRLVTHVPELLGHPPVSTFYQQNPRIAKTYGIDVLLGK